MDETYAKHLSFPFRIGTDNRTVTTSSPEEHIKEELIQLLLTNPGERTFLVEFGGGIRRMVFEGLYDNTHAMIKVTLTQAITRWLGNRLVLENLIVNTVDNAIEIELRYRIKGSDQSKIIRFRREGM